MTRSIAVLFCVLLLAPATGRAQETLSQQHSPQVTALLDGLESVLRTHYVFQEQIDDILDHLRARQEAGAYRDADTPEALAQALTSDLMETTQDSHFFVAVDSAWIASHRERDQRLEEIQRDERAHEESINHGFVRAERLTGNVGYLRLDYFANMAYARESAAAAMRFVQHSDALILDMRYNRGGHMEMVQFLTSYLFPADEDILLFNYVFPDGGGERVEPQHVLPSIPGRRMTEIPVVVLTAATSFSAGEWLAYVLQKLGRATVVGQRTTGAAHSVLRFPIDDRFLAQVPASLTRDPVDGGDFEVEGVAPDVEVLSHLALDVAHEMILDDLAETDPSINTEWMRPVFEARRTPPADVEAILQRAAGRYEGRDLTVEDGDLIYRWRERFSARLTPLTETLFAVEEVDDWRFRLVIEDGEVVALERVFPNGPAAQYARLGSHF